MLLVPFLCLLGVRIVFGATFPPDAFLTIFDPKRVPQKHTPKDTPKSVDFHFLLTDSPAGLQGHVFNDSGATL